MNLLESKINDLVWVHLRDAKFKGIPELNKNYDEESALPFELGEYPLFVLLDLIDTALFDC